MGRAVEPTLWTYTSMPSLQPLPRRNIIASETARRARSTAGFPMEASRGGRSRFAVRLLSPSSARLSAATLHRHHLAASLEPNFASRFSLLSLSRSPRLITSSRLHFQGCTSGDSNFRMSASTPNVDLQQRINVLRTQYGDNSEGLRDAVAQLLQREGLGQTSLGGSSYGAAPSTPVAGLSQAGASTPLLHSSRSGRIIKPSKPFTTPAAAARPSPYPASHHRPSSSLNPNRAPPPPPRLPLSTSAAPVPPLTAITETRYQAQYTTYPSRMRLGTSSLMQPNALAASGKGDNTPAAAGKRSRAAVNYAELEGISAEVAEEEPKGGMVPKRGLVPGTPGGAAVEAKQAWGDGKSYLGVLPPGNMVIVQQAIKTKHQVL